MPAPSDSSKPTSLLTKALATAAVWSIVGVAAWRLRVPYIELVLLGLGVSFTAVIWMDKTGKERK